MLLRINTDNPEQRKIDQAVQIMRRGGVIIYPTDTVYGLGCDISSQKAINQICRIKGIKPEKAQFSFICQDISQVAEFAYQIDNDIFKLLKKNLPGPFTFILKGNNKLPKSLKNRRKTIGVRIPQNNIAIALVETLGMPLLSTSLKLGDDIQEYFTDPLAIFDDYKKIVDVVIDGGIGGFVPSTVVDCTGGEPVIIREGAGELE